MFLDRQRVAVVGIAGMRELGLTELAEDLARRLSLTLDRAHAMANVQSVLTQKVVDELESHSVRAVPLKGVVLAERLYDDPGARESSDIDILVAPNQLDEAVGVIRRRLGYQPPVDAVDAAGRPLLHYSLDHARGWPSIEIHWRVHWYEESSGEAMVKGSSLSGGVRRLLPRDELACLLLFYARDAFIGLRNLAAISAWWDRFGDELPSDGLSSFVAGFPELGPALATSATIAEVLTGVPRSRLGSWSSPLGLRQHGAARMTNVESDGARVQLEADIALVDLLLSPRTELTTFVRRQKLLNASFIAVRGDAHDDWFHRLIIGPRMLRGGARLLRALARTVLPSRHGGRTSPARLGGAVRRA